MKAFYSYLPGLLVALPLLAAEAEPALAPVSLQVGQQFTVMLESNAGTGYIWQVAEPAAGSKVINVELFGTAPQDSFCCGFPVPVTLTITGEKPGTEIVRVIYARPWEKGKAPAREMRFQVKVSAAAR